MPAACASSTAQLAVPAYFGPWERAEWDVLIDRRPGVVVINPANGPGRACERAYGDVIGRCRTIGAEVLGYLSTRWLDRPVDETAEEAARYRDWYGVSGLFFDEVPNVPTKGRVKVLSRLNDLTPPGQTVFNCGQPIPDRWYRLLPDVRWGTFEGSPAQLAATSFRGPARRQMHFVHSVTNATVGAVRAELHLRDVGFACVTTDQMPNPWDVCPQV